MVALGLVVGVGALLGVVTGRSLPQTSGNLRLAGLDAPVLVHRDESGIARIVGETPHDLFMAQGYVHAQERMWQMEVWRHISAGRLSELFGESTLDTDRFIRTLGWRQAAERDLAAFAPETVAILAAYAAGVNAWLDEHRGGLGLPFVVVGLQSGSGGLGGYEPEPWTPLDSAAWQKVQAWNLSGNFSTELFNWLADAQLGDPARTDDLTPPYPAGAPVITPTATAAERPATAAAEGGPTGPIDGGSTATAADLAAVRRLASIGADIPAIAGLDRSDGLAGAHGIGSNSWVVAPARSASGGALLANDPHLGLGMPSVWFMNGLHCRVVSEACPYDVAGVSFPGDPGIILGHNARIAWGATNAGLDVQDLFVETVDPNDPDAYLDGGVSVPFTVRREEIRVAGAEPVVLDVRETRRGPIVSDVVDDLADAPPVALRWVSLVEPDHTLEAIFGLNTAGSFDAFRDALRLYGAPAQNFIYADVDGHIGYQLPGFVPVRRGGGVTVRPAEAGGAAEWAGRLPFEALPWQYDPPSGIIVTANNAPVDAAFPHALGTGWDYGDRAARISALLEEAAPSGVTPAEMAAIQTDVELLRAERLMARVEAAPATTDGNLVLATLRSWDSACDVESHGCAAYAAFEFALARRIFDDELGPLAREYTATDGAYVRVANLLDEPDAPWWDDVTTSDRVEQPPEIVAAALDQAGADLRAALGGSEDWTWGRLHGLTLREDTLGASGIGPLEWYFNGSTREAPGAAGAVDNLYYDPSVFYPDPDEPDAPAKTLTDAFAVTNGPSYRLVIDLSDLDGARLIQTTGQSGNPFDGHYGDLVDRWLAGELLPLPWDRERVAAEAAATLTLTP